MENYFIFDMIGEGSFGKVYKGQRKGSNQIVAIKKIFKKGKKEKELKNLRQEIEILRKLYHENIIQLLDSFETNNEFYLVTELAQGQLFEILEEDKHMPETEIKKIAYQLISALFYLHSNHIIHRDIKPQNVLIGSNGVIKLCDFGFARAIDSKTMITSIKGTPLYMAPELLQEYPYNQSADLWSLGVILYELFVGQPPFYTNNFTTLMNKIIKENVKYSDSMSKDFKDFLKGLLIKNPRDRFDWQKILDHPYMRETDVEKSARVIRQENYQKWILRLKNEKVFNLFESDQYLAKFSNLTEVENGTKGFVEFDNNNINVTNLSDKSSASTKVTKKSSNTYLNEEFWLDIEAKINSEEAATALRRDVGFADKINTAFKNIISEDKEKISDKKLVCLIVKIIFSVLTKGKIDNQNVDITKNQAILNHALSIFKISQSEDLQILLNDIIKVIGLFAKFSCYYSNGIDINFCSGFMKYFPGIIQSQKPSNIHINLVKAVGIMITAANMIPRRSLIFYKTILDLKIIQVLVTILKNYKTYTHLLVRSSCECLAILINPMNGDIYNFPILRYAQFENYADFKTFFGYLDSIKKDFLTVFLDQNLGSVFPVIYDYETDISLKTAILRITVQLFDYAPKEMSAIFKTFNSPFVTMINNIFTSDEMEQKLLIQLGLLLLIKIAKFCSVNKINLNEFGIDFSKPTSYVNKLFSNDFVTISLSFGLISELLGSPQFQTINPKYFKSIKDITKFVQGKGREENKKLEGTNFGFHRNGILDYPIMYLEKLYQKVSSKDKTRAEFIQGLSEVQFDEVLVELLSNISYKNDISPRGIASILNLTHDLIIADYKMLLKKLVKDNVIKILATLIKEKQFFIVSEWPSLKKEEGSAIAQQILTGALKLLKIASDVNSVNEEIIRNDFFINLKSSYKYISKENYILPISIIFNLVNEKANNDDVVNSLTTEFFTKDSNLGFIDQYNILKDYSNKELIIETLLLLSSLCRKNERVYQSIHDINIYTQLRYLMENSDSSIKSRVCNLIGNMCRHSDFFYELILQHGLIRPLIECCYDNEKNTRKFACFAIGNAAFLNDRLYENLKPCIPILVSLLEDTEENTRANSAGALGNFVRCSDILCNEINANGAPEALLKLAEKENTSNQTIKVALFALGNFCNHTAIKSQLESINFKRRIDSIKARFQGESSLTDLLDRIKKKIS